MDFSEYTAEIESADSQASYKDGVLVVVTGSLTGRDNIRRKFTQSFFLAPQEKGGYVVLNDIFRFVDPSQPRGANQVIVNGTNGDVLATALSPEPGNTDVVFVFLFQLILRAIQLFIFAQFFFFF